MQLAARLCQFLFVVVVEVRVLEAYGHGFQSGEGRS